MRYSRMLIPTMKEVPAEAEIASHRLMLRAGYIRKLAAGTYTYLPLGWRSLRKVIEIVREEMDAAGAQEVLMPVVQPLELWRRTGRDAVYEDILAVFSDHHGRRNALAATAEEVVTALAAGELSSYRQLPITLYQINTKFRDEFRPQYGVIRSREFLMKDAYSFDADASGLDASYRKMYEAYCRIFARCGLRTVVVEAESGGMGGTDTEEFMVPCEVGDVFVTTADGGYAANIERAEVDPPAGPPPAREDVPPMEPVHTPGVGSIEAVCAFLKTKPAEMIKTLVYVKGSEEAQRRFLQLLDASQKALDDVLQVGIPLTMSTEEVQLALKSGTLSLNAVRRAAAYGLEMPVSGTTHLSLVKSGRLSDVEVERLAALYRRAGDFFSLRGEVAPVLVAVRGDHEVNEGKLAQRIGGGFGLAPEAIVQFVTGAAVGFAGIQRSKAYLLAHRVVIDHAVAAMGAGVSGANRTDYHVRNVVPGRDFPLAGENVTVADIRNAAEGDTHGGQPLTFAHGVEVGHVFKLGSKYSEALGANVLDERGRLVPCVMGCYGIGINRILAMAIETGHDEQGCVLPVSIAPFEVLVLAINMGDEAVVAEAGRIADELEAAGVEVLLDDRDARPGVKFKDADLIGVPLRVTVGARGLKEGKVEVKRRTDPEPTLVPAGEAVAEARRVVDGMKADLRRGADL